jgi:hypothetical protein
MAGCAGHLSRGFDRTHVSFPAGAPSRAAEQETAHLSRKPESLARRSIQFLAGALVTGVALAMFANKITVDCP